MISVLSFNTDLTKYCNRRKNENNCIDPDFIPYFMDKIRRNERYSPIICIGLQNTKTRGVTIQKDGLIDAFEEILSPVGYKLVGYNKHRDLTGITSSGLRIAIFIKIEYKVSNIRKFNFGSKCIGVTLKIGEENISFVCIHIKKNNNSSQFIDLIHKIQSKCNKFIICGTMNFNLHACDPHMHTIIKNIMKHKLTNNMNSEFNDVYKKCDTLYSIIKTHDYLTEGIKGAGPNFLPNYKLKKQGINSKTTKNYNLLGIERKSNDYTNELPQWNDRILYNKNYIKCNFYYKFDKGNTYYSSHAPIIGKYDIIKSD